VKYPLNNIDPVIPMVVERMEVFFLIVYGKIKPLSKCRFKLLFKREEIFRKMKNYLRNSLTHYRPAMPFGNKKFILEVRFSSVLSQFKKISPL